MAELREKERDSEWRREGKDEEDDYMGDLSQFLPPETTNPSKLSAKKVSNWWLLLTVINCLKYWFCFISLWLL